MNERNGGIPKILYWIMGALLAICLTGAGATANWMSNRLAVVEATSGIIDSRSKVSESRIDILERTMIRIEAKLDRALERQQERGQR